MVINRSMMIKGFVISKSIQMLSVYRFSGILAIVILIGLMLSSGAMMAQENDNQLAFQYFQEKDFLKAAEYFDRLFTQTGSKIYFDYYYRCLMEMNQLEEAEKEIKKQYKKNKSEITYLVDLGYLYKRKNDFKQSIEYYEEALKNSLNNVQAVNKVGSAFISKSEFDYAERLYLEARDRLPGMTFRYELANVYISQRNYPKMVNEYLELILEKPEEIKPIQDRLLYFVSNDRDSSFFPILELALLRKSQNFSSTTIFPEMLIWLYIQQKDFGKALIQARAIDKRKLNDGVQVLSLARLASENGDYENALIGFNYVINLKSSLYTDAMLDLLTVNYKQIEEGTITNQESISQIEQNFQHVAAEFGLSPTTLRIIRNWAHLKAFYLNKPNEAIDILNTAIAISGIPFDHLANLKMEKADILLFQGNTWDAALLYGQVELENEQNPTGHEARFRKARLAYYSGNFNWAKAQLSVLKASTSKLIANDACELSALIVDNLVEEDTFSLALGMFARADMLVMQKQDSLANLSLDSIISDFATNTILDDVYYKKAQIAETNGEYQVAFDMFSKVTEIAPWDILADNAIFRMAEIARIHLGRLEEASELYKKIITDYSDSIFMTDARKQYRMLRGDIN